MASEVFAYESTVHLYTADDSDHPLYREVVVWCPGCDQRHSFTVEVLDPEFRRSGGEPLPVWQWDGNLERPTFSPSLLAYYTIHLCEGEHGPKVCEDPDACGQTGHLIMNDDWKETGTKVLGHHTPHTRDPAWGNCHSFLKEGRWQFLSDSAHALAGQTVDMVPIPEHQLKGVA